MGYVREAWINEQQLQIYQGGPKLSGLEDAPSVEAFTESTGPSSPWHFGAKE